MRIRPVSSGVKRDHFTTVIGIAVALFVALAFLMDAFLLLELGTLDVRFRMRGETRSPDQVVIVGIDDASFREMQLQWPWPRSLHGELIDALVAVGSRVIAFDLLFLEPSRLGPEDDAQLAEAAERAGNVIFGHKLTHTVSENFRTTVLDQPIRPLTEAAWSLGFVNHPLDPDHFVRRSHLYLAHQSEVHPALSTAAVSAYLTRSSGKWASRAIDSGAGWIREFDHIPILSRSSFEDTYVINFIGGSRAIRTVSYYQVLDGLVPPDWLEDKIVFVGAVTPDLEDFFATPFIHTGPMPGVELHANAAATLLNGNPLRLPSFVMTVAVIFSVVMVTAWICGRTSALKGFLVVAGLIMMLIAAAIWTFIFQDLWFQTVPPLVGVLLSYTLVNAYRFGAEERERRRIRTIFGRYVAPEVVEEILSFGEDIPLGGARQTATLLFADIRGFTSTTEQMPPEEIVAHLNEYLEVMTNVIFRHQGTIDKFMGDAIMVIFGAPLPRPDDALRCVRAAIDMRIALQDLQNRWENAGKPRFDMGIGINTGEVIIGNIGSKERMEYTAIGDDVNLAARLEALTKQHGGGILMAEATYRLVADYVDVDQIEPVIVQGKSKPVRIYKVLGFRGDRST